MFAMGQTTIGRKVGKPRRMSEMWKNNIAKWRDRAGLTQQQLAEKMDPPTSKGTISQYESGKRKPSQAMLDRIAKALDTTRGSLLDEAPPQTVDPLPFSVDDLQDIASAILDSAPHLSGERGAKALAKALLWTLGRLADQPEVRGNSTAIREAFVAGLSLPPPATRQ